MSRARPAAFNETATALDSLIRLSMPAHRRLMQEAGVAHRLRDNGWIFLYRSAEAFAGSRFARDVYDRFEIATQALDQAALRDLEPHLRPIFPRALWIKDTCSVDDPGRVVEAYAALFQARGGDLMRQEITALRRVTQGLWQLRGRDGRTTTAHRVVIALGPWANDLLKPLGAAAPWLSSAAITSTLPRPPAPHWRGRCTTPPPATCWRRWKRACGSAPASS